MMELVLLDAIQLIIILSRSNCREDKKMAVVVVVM